jgi:1-deoxy-D-xylulose-5-phosphate reductoisomerase
MEKHISILGSTGSIGVQALNVVRDLNKYKDLNIQVMGLTAHKNINLLEKQAREFRPKAISITDPKLAKELAPRLKDLDIKIFYGDEGLIELASLEGTNMVLNSIVGFAGLIPTLEAIRHKKTVALANKETLVVAGELIIEESKNNGVEIIPIDSEHSAIFQCLIGRDPKSVSKLILTASGGPFRGLNHRDLAYVTPSDALKHPNWEMGNKITIDSATLMNKGLEVIEAKWLFGVNEKDIEVLIHPQSLIHSMVEYIDGSIMAKLSTPDMRLPIQLALTYPKCYQNTIPKLDLIKNNSLTFEKPDKDTFPCLGLAYEALEELGTMPAVMNGANEIAVDLFLSQKIGFNQIPQLIKTVMKNHTTNKKPTINDIIKADEWARKQAITLWKN